LKVWEETINNPTVFIAIKGAKNKGVLSGDLERNKIN